MKNHPHHETAEVSVHAAGFHDDKAMNETNIEPCRECGAAAGFRQPSDYYRVYSDLWALRRQLRALGIKPDLVSYWKDMTP